MHFILSSSMHCQPYCGAGLTTNTVFVFCTVIFCTVTVFKTVTVNSICSLKILCYQKTVTVKQKFGWQQKSKKYL